MGKYCRKMNQSAGLDEQSVYCLNGSFEIEALIKSAITIDILVAPVFCFDVIVQHMPKLTTRLRYVWFHQIDEMFDINEELTINVAEKLLADDLDIQVNIAIALKTFVFASFQFKISYFYIFFYYFVCVDCDIIHNLLSHFGWSFRSCKSSDDFDWWSITIRGSTIRKMSFFCCIWRKHSKNQTIDS